MCVCVGAGGVTGFLNKVKKTALFSRDGFPYIASIAYSAYTPFTASTDYTVYSAYQALTALTTSTQCCIYMPTLHTLLHV